MMIQENNRKHHRCPLLGITSIRNNNNGVAIKSFPKPISCQNSGLYGNAVNQVLSMTRGV